MKGRIFLAQTALFLLSALFFFIAYGAGIWWSMELRGLSVSMTLWKICSSYGDNEACSTLSNNYMEEGKKFAFALQFLYNVKHR